MIIRQTTNENAYILAKKSINVRIYLHSHSKRAKTQALLDSGATENFMTLDYAQHLHLPIKELNKPQMLYNVDGTIDKAGIIKYCTDLKVQTGTNHTWMRFFLSNLGQHQLILGYPWFAAVQPKVDWKQGWIDITQLPIVIQAIDTAKA